MELNEPKGNYFGGEWTKQKLNVLQRYLNAYNLALKNKSFTRIYIDAYAGSGEIVPKKTQDAHYKNELFTTYKEDVIDSEFKEYIDGSTKIALDLENKFDEYWFNDMNYERYKELLELKEKSPFKHQIHCSNKDANDFLPNVMKKYRWKNERAVVFLDPYGASVKYETLKQIAKTQGLDIWILFPLGQAINRLLTKDFQKLPKEWKNKLNEVFGTDEWKYRLYEKEQKLFYCGEEGDLKKKKIEDINEFYLERMGLIFARTANHSKILYNSKKSPLFSLNFCMTSESYAAQGLALRIANHLLKDH